MSTTSRGYRKIADSELDKPQGVNDALDDISADVTALEARVGIGGSGLTRTEADGLYRAIGYVPAFADLTARPTTIGGYGITDAVTSGLFTSAMAAKADLVAGKIPTSQLPPITIGESFTVGSQAAMLALTAQIGDVAIRTDLANKKLLLLGNSATLADWVDFVSTGNVASVNGRTGAVVLSKADVGLPLTDNTTDLQKPISNATQAALDNLLVPYYVGQADYIVGTGNSLALYGANINLLTDNTLALIRAKITPLSGRSSANVTGTLTPATGKTQTVSYVGNGPLVIGGATINLSGTLAQALTAIKAANGARNTITFGAGASFIPIGGVASPTVAPVFNTGAGGSFTNGTYLIGYSYLNATGETALSPLLSYTRPNGEALQFGITPMPAGATKFRLYISSPGGDASTMRLFLEKTSVGDQTFTIGNYNASGALPPTGNTTGVTPASVVLPLVDPASAGTQPDFAVIASAVTSFYAQRAQTQYQLAYSGNYTRSGVHMGASVFISDSGARVFFWDGTKWRAGIDVNNPDSGMLGGTDINKPLDGWGAVGVTFSGIVAGTFSNVSTPATPATANLVVSYDYAAGDLAAVAAIPATGYTGKTVGRGLKSVNAPVSAPSLVANDISDSSALGKSLIKATDAAGARATLQLGDSATRDVGTGPNTVAAGDITVNKNDVINVKKEGAGVEEYLISGEVSFGRRFGLYRTADGNEGGFKADSAFILKSSASGMQMLVGNAYLYLFPSRANAQMITFDNQTYGPIFFGKDTNRRMMFCDDTVTPHSNVQSAGSVALGTHSFANVAIALSDQLYSVGFDTTNASIVQTLPDPATCVGRKYSIWKTVAANTLTITGVAGGDVVLNAQFACVNVVSEGAFWRVESRN